MQFWGSLLEIFSREWTVFLAAMLPIFELRASIPLGFSLGMNPVESLFFSWSGGMIPVIPIILILRVLLEKMEQWSQLTRKFALWLRRRTEKRSRDVKRYGVLGLYFLVALPLPYTGVWTGSMVAALLHIPLKKALLAIAAGNLTAGLIVTALSYHLF